MVGLSRAFLWSCLAAASAQRAVAVDSPRPHMILPCVADRCQNGWHDLNKDTWTCVNDNITTDKTFHDAIGKPCSGTNLEVAYQTCTAPCCECWAAYWPALLDLWRRCGAPESYVTGQGVVGLRAKEDWLCGRGEWGQCVRPKWEAAQVNTMTACTSAPDKTKLNEVFGLYRDRRSDLETCACIGQAYVSLDSILQECEVPNWQWFQKYAQRRFHDNSCGTLRDFVPEQLVSVARISPLFAVVVGAVASTLILAFVVASRWRKGVVGGVGAEALLADDSQLPRL